MSLATFLEQKRQLARPTGFEPAWIPGFLYPFQAELLRWQLRLGRGLLLADCGLGKTPIALAVAANVCQKTKGRALILSPLAVGPQFVTEGEKFSIPVHHSRDGKLNGAEITVTNYEQIEKFNPADFQCVVADESSCIKNWMAKRRGALTEFLRTVPYRMLDTATAAPNDYHELGTSAEALGHLGYFDMLAYFFINDENSLHPTSLGARWRFKKAAERPFWRWVCSWARAVRKPSDIGDFDDSAFQLPPLLEREHIVKNTRPLPGYLPGIDVEAVTIQEQREERKLNIKERCELAAELADHGDPVAIWTESNDEADMIEKLIPDAKQVHGHGMSDAAKEARFRAFADGSLRVMVTKPKIGAWGLNWQHCSRVISFVSHSFEQDYQAVRRCWRFGQKRPVTVDRIATPGEARVLRNLKRKAAQAERMFDQLVKMMNDPQNLAAQVEAAGKVKVPSWLT